MDYFKTLRNNNKICSRTVSESYSCLFSSDLTIRFVLSGNECYHIGRRNLSIFPDSFIVLNKGSQFSTNIDSCIAVQSFFIIFDQKFVADFINCWRIKDSKLLNSECHNGSQSFEFKETIFPFHGDMMYNIFHLKSHLDNGLKDELLINEYLYHCLLNYFRIYNEEIFMKTEKLNFLSQVTRTEILRRLNLAKEYLSSNYNHNISLDELAKYSGLSVTHLLRTFKQAFNLTPHQFLMQIRLRRARLLLKNTKYSISEVVGLVGFECPSSFIRLFKTNYNITPLKYRQIA
jgi:AraC family transcriptional regulator